jgi:hypothetical protein
MKLSVFAEGDADDMLANKRPREIALEYETIDIEGRRDPPVDAVEQRLRHLAHLGAIVDEAVGGDGVKVFRAERHDRRKILVEEGTTVLVVTLL